MKDLPRMDTPYNIQEVLRENEQLKRHVAQLEEENTRLKNQIAEFQHPELKTPSISELPVPDKSSPMYTLSSDEKVALFRCVFRGREDVFARSWHSASSGKSGYQPVCENEWRADLCDKKQYKCSECPNRRHASLSDRDIFNHLFFNLSIFV